MLARAPWRILHLAALLVAGALLLGAWGDADGSAASGPSKLEQAVRTAPVTAGPDAPVIAADDYFAPKVLKVQVGTTLTFTNKGRRIHNVIPVGGGGYRIDTDELRPGASKTVRIERGGTYRYFCSIHGTATSGMRGTIAVVG